MSEPLPVTDSSKVPNVPLVNLLLGNTLDWAASFLVINGFPTNSVRGFCVSYFQ